MLAAGDKFLHAHELNEDFIFNQVEYLAACLTNAWLMTMLLVTAHYDVPATGKMSNSVHVAERIGNVETGGMSI